MNISGAGLRGRHRRPLGERGHGQHDVKRRPTSTHLDVGRPRLEPAERCRDPIAAFGERIEHIWPCSSVTTVRGAPRAGPATVNVTPGNTLPVASRTTPASRPAGCADAASTPTASRQPAHTSVRRISRNTRHPGRLRIAERVDLWPGHQRVHRAGRGRGTTGLPAVVATVLLSWPPLLSRETVAESLQDVTRPTKWWTAAIGTEPVEILRKALCFHQDCVPAFRAPADIPTRDRLAVELRRSRLGRHRNHMVVTPGEVLLPTRTVRRPNAVEAGPPSWSPLPVTDAYPRASDPLHASRRPHHRKPAHAYSRI